MTTSRHSWVDTCNRVFFHPPPCFSHLPRSFACACFPPARLARSHFPVYDTGRSITMQLLVEIRRLIPVANLNKPGISKGQLRSGVRASAPSSTLNLPSSPGLFSSCAFCLPASTSRSGCQASRNRSLVIIQHRWPGPASRETPQVFLGQGRQGGGGGG